MRFSAATFVALLASNALAGPVARASAPAPMGPFNTDMTLKSNETMVEEAILFAAQADADCSFGNCAGVLASAACIALGIFRADPGAVVDCVSGGSEKVGLEPAFASLSCNDS